MRRLYRILLHLYPEAYRSDFSNEMLTVFECLLDEQADRGVLARVRFGSAEFGGLLLGACVQRLGSRPALVLKSTNMPVAAKQPNCHSNLDEIAEAEQRVRFHLSQTIECIATHKFSGARFHSGEEGQARERLRLLQTFTRREAEEGRP
jgi:hypothetical protein